jgi:hypothetical protein
MDDCKVSTSTTVKNKKYAMRDGKTDWTKIARKAEKSLVTPETSE